MDKLIYMVPKKAFRPSVFQLNAIETLDDTLYTSIEKVFKVIGWCNNQLHADIMSLLTTGLIQFWCLCKTSSTFAQNFYGISITNADGSIVGSTITSITSLLSTYMENNIRGDNFLGKIIPKALAIYACAKSLQTLAYLSKVTSTHSPAMMLLSMKYTPNNLNQTSNNSVSAWIADRFTMIAFLLQFTRWWYTARKSESFGQSKPLFPTEKLQAFTNVCPVCEKKPVLPIAVSLSGYVYCHKCIISAINLDGRCPVSKYPINFSDLIRLYSD